MDARPFLSGDTFRVDFDIPGVHPATIELTVEENVLTVKAEWRWSAREGVETLEVPHFDGHAPRIDDAALQCCDPDDTRSGERRL